MSDRVSAGGSYGVNRRGVLLGLAAGAFSSAGCGRGEAGSGANMASGSGAAAVRLAPRRVLTLSKMGVDRFATRDQWKALVAALEAAAHDGLTLEGEADARYRHDGPLSLVGVSFDGRGATLVALSDGPQVLRCVGSGWRLANLTLLGAAKTRDADNQKNGLLIGDHDAAPAQDFEIDNVTVGSAAPGLGFAGAGIMFNRAHRGRISNVRISDSRADGFHVTNRSSDLTFTAPSSARTGDDGFAVVSYRSQGQPCSAIAVRGAAIVEPVGRGLSVVGGRAVRYEGCRVDRSSAAGIYLYGESDYDTFGVADCHVRDIDLRDCVTGVGMPPDFAHAVLMIGGRDGSDAVAGGTLTRGAADCSARAVRITGGGRGSFAGIALNEHAERTRLISPTIRNLLAVRSDRQPNGVEIGGGDTAVDALSIDGLAGTPIIVTRGASGSVAINRPDVRRARLTPSRVGSFNAFCYVDDAPRLTSMTVTNGRFAAGPKRLVTDLLRPGRLRMTGNSLDGKSL